MSFDIQKYLVENGLTRNSSNRKKEDLLQDLRDQLRAIQDQFGFVDGKPPKTGVGTKDDRVLKNYERVVGNLPQRIKDLEDKRSNERNSG